MKMKRTVVLLCGCMAALIVLSAPMARGVEVRLWRDATGKFQVAASLESVKDGNVRLIKADGRMIDVPISKLSDEDLLYIKRAQQTVHDKHLEELRRSHTTWLVRVVRYETHEER